MEPPSSAASTSSDAAYSVRALSAAADLFSDRAVRDVEKKYGDLILHQGLVILRIEDLGLRTTLMHRMRANLRTLGGPYLAIPRGLAAEAEKIVRKEGFAPRRIA